MRIAVTGSTGMVGTALLPLLLQSGHEVLRVVREKRTEPGKSGYWNPSTGEIDLASLEGIDAAVHLAGENIASGRWSSARKKRIRESRVNGTRLIAESLAKLRRRPEVLISASAIGYYGDRGNEILREDSPSGTGFLAEVCRLWEAGTEPAVKKSIRVVHLRFGIILSSHGGALAKMLPPFKLGLGGRIGSGSQYMSWISLDEVCSVILFCLRTAAVRGAVNAVSPTPVTNAEFTRVLGLALSRPTFFPLPAFAARIALGEMADELLLSSARVEPAKLAEAGYAFRHKDLEPTLRLLLQK